MMGTEKLQNINSGGAMKRHPQLERDQIIEILDVDIVKGRRFWKKVSKYHNEKNGTEAGTIQVKQGQTSRCNITIGGIAYRRYRLVFMVAYGLWPDLIDHIDGDSLNDSAANLREATIIQNCWNHKPHRKILPYPAGVRITPKGRFTARIGYNKKLITIGTFDSSEEASMAYLEKQKELFGEFSFAAREALA